MRIDKVLPPMKGDCYAMKLILAIVNNDDSAEVASILR